MTNQHPITPPPELVGGWILESDIPGEDMYEGIATRAARWGADCELNACCEWLRKEINGGWWLDNQLTTARRPKPPTLKEQALAALETEPEDAKELIVFDMDQIDIIRRALEALPE
jgi:hypothetical protein